MPVAIKTKFISPTETRQSRVTARTMDSGPVRKVTLNWDHSLTPEGNHGAAAFSLAKKLGWDGDWHIADGGEVYLFVRVTSWSKMFTVTPDSAEEA